MQSPESEGTYDRRFGFLHIGLAAHPSKYAARLSESLACAVKDTYTCEEGDRLRHGLLAQTL